MIWIILIGLTILCIMFPPARGIVFHPFKALYYAVKDVIIYFKDKKYNECESGFIDVYCGLFGQGKTLSATNRLIHDYRRYNGKQMRIDGKMLTIEVRLFSNVELQGVPYTKFTTMQQLVDWSTFGQLPENHNKYAIFLIDEASSVLNSRAFRNNLNYFSINSMLTCRHSRAGLILTSQRFGQIDKLCREVCQKVIQCSKMWRVISHYIYDAYELENVANPLSIKPKAISTHFCSDKSYKGYDTLALVEQITKDCVDGKMRSDEEILTAISPETMINTVPEDRIKKRWKEKRNKNVA